MERIETGDGFIVKMFVLSHENVVGRMPLFGGTALAPSGLSPFGSQAKPLIAFAGVHLSNLPQPWALTGLGLNAVATAPHGMSVEPDAEDCEMPGVAAKLAVEQGQARVGIERLHQIGSGGAERHSPLPARGIEAAKPMRQRSWLSRRREPGRLADAPILDRLSIPTTEVDIVSISIPNSSSNKVSNHDQSKDHGTTSKTKESGGVHLPSAQRIEDGVTVRLLGSIPIDLRDRPMIKAGERPPGCGWTGRVHAAIRP